MKSQIVEIQSDTRDNVSSAEPVPEEFIAYPLDESDPSPRSRIGIEAQPVDPNTEIGCSATEYEDYLAQVVTQQPPPDDGSSDKDGLDDHDGGTPSSRFIIQVVDPETETACPTIEYEDHSTQIAAQQLPSDSESSDEDQDEAAELAPLSWGKAITRQNNCGTDENHENEGERRPPRSKYSKRIRLLRLGRRGKK